MLPGKGTSPLPAEQVSQEAQEQGNVAAVLARNKQTQEELKQELLHAAALLKTTSRQLGASIQRDAAVLAHTEAALERSVLRTKRERGALGLLTQSSWSTTLLLWASVGVVACLFAGVLVMLRLWRALPGTSGAVGAARSLDSGWLW